MSGVLSPHFAFANYFKAKELFPLLQHLSLKMSEGNICMDISKDNDLLLEETTSKKIDIKILEKHPLIGKNGSTKPFILHHQKLYTHKFFHFEGAFIQKIIQLTKAEDITKKWAKLQAYKEIIWGQLFQKSETVDWQLIACLSAYIHNFCIITGGPGTGKTTTVSKLLCLHLLDNPNAKIILAAPTGKAAARMKESQTQIRKNFSKQGIHIPENILATIENLDAKTLHRTLGYIPDSIHFKHNADNPLEADLIIVDECSMIDITMFKKLLDAIDYKRTKLVLLGDKNQLASVEAGSLFGDLCNTLPQLNTFDKNFIQQVQNIVQKNWDLPQLEQTLPLSQRIIALQKSYRFEDNKGIGKLSKAILNSSWKSIESCLQGDEEEVSMDLLTTQYLDLYVAQLWDKKNGYCNEPDILKALQKTKNTKILCATKEGETGVYAINDWVDKKMRKANNIRSNTPFYINQLIMVTQNQNELQIFNGDIGIIRALPNTSGEMQLYACFEQGEDEFLKILPGNINAWELAYAITIHKSQGSEFEKVFVVIPSIIQNVGLLTKELIYTAVTRAKKEVKLLCDVAPLQAAVMRSMERISGIQERISEFG